MLLESPHEKILPSTGLLSHVNVILELFDGILKFDLPPLHRFVVILLSFYPAPLACLLLKGSQVQNTIMSQKGHDQHELHLNTLAKRKHSLEFWGLKSYASYSQEIAEEYWDPWPETVQHSCLFIFCYSSITAESKHTNTIKK